MGRVKATRSTTRQTRGKKPTLKNPDPAEYIVDSDTDLSSLSSEDLYSDDSIEYVSAFHCSIFNFIYYALQTATYFARDSCYKFCVTFFKGF